MIEPQSDPLGGAILEQLAELEFDYIELSLRDLLALPQPEFEELAKRLRRSGIGSEACNNFFPASIRLTGPEADHPRALAYARQALAKAAALDAKIVVFGSSAAKNVPPGFPHDSAWRQIVALLQALGPIAQQHGATIAIEPLHRGESNIVNTAAEGLRLAREVDHPAVQLLVDTYHLKMEDEAASILLEAGPALRHMHFAEGEARLFPLEERGEYEEFFQMVKRIGYAGRCSIEAYTSDFVCDAARALKTLRAAAKRAGV
jgi:sugar phosphate isomerase/epimerase